MRKLFFAPAALLCLLFCAGAALLRAEEAAALPVTIAADDPNIRYSGRWDRREKDGPRCAWPGSSVRLKFQGTAVNARIAFNGRDLFQVLVDGKPAGIIKFSPGQTTYSLAKDLPAAEHTAELYKRTEPMVGTAQFLGCQLEAGGKLLPLPKPPERRIEFVGDSITCGYGNEAADQNQPFTPETENNYLTYSSLAARELGAEHITLAWSGRTMWPHNTMPEIYGRTLPQDPKSTWDFTSWIPQAVVINLGTNEFGGGTPDEKGWSAAYKDFIARVRKNYPGVQVYCTIGSMLNDNWPPQSKALTTIRGYLTALVAELNKAGDAKVHFLEFAVQDVNNDGGGANWHPSLKTHQKMAAKLVEALKKDLGW